MYGLNRNGHVSPKNNWSTLKNYK